MNATARVVAAVAVLAALAAGVGFAVLPYASRDFAEGGLWDAICRAAGVPASWSGAPAAKGFATSTAVLEPARARAEGGDAGHGATLAHARCTMCHGPEAMSRSDAPLLAGQYPEVIYKQLLDYRGGQRSHAFMQAIAAPLTDQQVRDLAAFYGSLEKFTRVAEAVDRRVPALVRVGDPLRNIAPCASCHGGYDQKIGSPWLEGMPQAYLEQQLRAFSSSARRNDLHGLMRNGARQLSDPEIHERAAYYASRPAETRQ